MKFYPATLLFVAAVPFCVGCQESIPPKAPRSLPSRAVAQPLSERAAMDASGRGEQIQALIRDLAKIEDQKKVKLSPSTRASDFVPARQMYDSNMMNPGIRHDDAFTKLVKIGPPALPYLLDSLEDKTPTKLTIDHTGSDGGMWYGERPALRWAADEASNIRRMGEEQISDIEIAKRLSSPADFITLAKSRELPFFSTPSRGEFNPKNQLEQNVLAQARTELPGARNDDPFGKTAISSYTVTIGDVCYLLVGQIVNRPYVASQYQMSSCYFIVSPTHNSQLAADVRAVWASNDPTEMLYQSLQTDFADDGGSFGDALVRLGYYYPERSEPLLLECVAKVEAGDKKNDQSTYESRRMIHSLFSSKNQKVRDRLFRLLQTAQDPYYFVDVQSGFGREHDPLILKRTLSFIEGLPKDKEGRGDSSLLAMLGLRFPEQAIPIYKEFVASPTKERRDTIINELWSSPLAPELLPPLLEDKRLLKYAANARVCDRAAQAISNNAQEVEFDDESPEATRDELIQKIKAHCLGTGVGKKTPPEKKGP